MEYFFFPLGSRPKVAHVQADTYTLRSRKWCSYSVFLISMDLILKVKLFTCCLQMCQRGNGHLLSILTVWQKEDREIRSLFVLPSRGSSKHRQYVLQADHHYKSQLSESLHSLLFFSHFHCFLSVPVGLQGHYGTQ